MENQNYKNHRRLVPLYHFVLYSIVLVCLIASCYRLYWAVEVRQGRLNAAILLGLSAGLLLITLLARQFALRAQDRAIRAEENLRHLVLTGKPLDSRLTMKQVIALRFANDTELVPLAQRAANEKLKDDDIKKAIVSWRGDFHRA